MEDSGSSRATCPRSRAPSVAMRGPAQLYDTRAADNRREKHRGEKCVQCDLLDSLDVRGVGIDCRVADVSHPIMGVAEACDNGHSVLFSPPRRA
eukprot:7491887-Pyramimonas_sp.AAC.1